MQLFRRLSFTMLLMSMMILVACGGGDGDLTGGGDGGTTGAVTLAVTKSDGDLSAANDVTVTATVVDNGSAVVNKTVTFTLAVDGSATFSPVSGAVTTDANGIATVTVKVTDVKGSVNVIASYESTTDNISFNSAGDGVKIVEGEPQAASIRLFASSQQLASSGAQSIELSAIAKDNNNNLLEGVTINFASDSGALGKVLDSSGSSPNVTGPDGKVTMELSTQDEPSNRIINVTVTSGDITDSLGIEVVGTTVTLTGSSSLALDDETSYIINVLDSDGNGVAKTDVMLSLGGGGAGIELPSPALVTTDSEGQATIKITGTSGGTNSIVVTALGAAASQDVSVQADSFLFTSFSNGITIVNPSDTPIVPDVSLNPQLATIILTWQRGGVAVVGKKVKFTTTRGTLLASDDVTIIKEGTTNADGQVTVKLTASDAGKALITFVGNDTVDTQVIELTNQLEFEFFADTAATIRAQASPSSIGPNQQTSTISAVVNDSNGNLVKNKRVKFVLEDISGGSIFPATAVTDSSGKASTVYTSNSISAKDGVSVTTVVEDTPGIEDVVKLTVADRELFISLGTGNELEELGSTDYVKEYSVFVTDGDSNAVEGIELTISALPYKYYKGYWYAFYDGNDFKQWGSRGADGLEETSDIFIPAKSCDNEDINFDGILQVGEDSNGDFKLTPGNKVSVEGAVTTDINGRATIRLIYSQSYATWLDIKLIASTRVTGTESSAEAIFNLDVLSTDVLDEDLTPPTSGIGLRGPFGLLNDCNLNISDDPNIDGT